MSRVFIFGSGASRGAGIPAVKDKNIVEVIIRERKAGLILNKCESKWYSRYEYALKSVSYTHLTLPTN